MPRSIPSIVFLALVAPAAYAQTASLGLADSLQSAFDYPAAIEVYRSALRNDTAKAYALLNGLSTAENFLGLDLLASGKRDRAKVHFGRALETAEKMVNEYPDSADSHFDLAAAKGNLALLSGAKAKVSMGREVEDHALRAVALDSMHSDALSVLGVFYREVAQLSWLERLAANTLFGGVPSGSLDKSEHYLRKALAADPESSFAAFELGQTLIALDRPDDARAMYLKLLEMEPRNSENARDMQKARRWLQENGN